MLVWLLQESDRMLVMLTAAAVLVLGGASAQEPIRVQFSVLENIGRNAYVGNVASSANLQALVPQEHEENVKFQLLDTDTNEYASSFFIDPQSSDVRVYSAIDREQVHACAYSATCTLTVRVLAVSESADFDFFQIVLCDITVEDRNDNAPRFAIDEITLSIPEDAPVMSQVPVQAADDRDAPENGISHYSLISVDVPQFSLVQTNDSSGLLSIYVRVSEPLDRESRDSFRLVIAAYDRGNKSGTLAVHVNIVDANDNQPAFTQPEYRVSVPEDTAVGDVVARVTAVDADWAHNADILYALQARSQAAHGAVFHVNDSSGHIRLTRALDFELTQRYTLYVTAQERYHDTLPVEAVVIISVVDMNDNAPRVTINAVTQSGNLEIRENAAVGTVIGLISTDDPDTGPGGQYDCSLHNNNNNNFRLTATSSSRSDFKIATNANFDREAQNQYSLLFVCADRGEPVQSSSLDVRISVLDENDNAPRFSQQLYNLTIAENNVVGATLLQVHAADDDFGENAQVEYGVNPDAVPYIAIEPRTGTVTARVAFDYEQYHSLSLGVTARDQGEPAHTATAVLNIAVLNVNDEPPVFQQSRYHFRLPEDTPRGSYVNTVHINSRDSAPAAVNFTIDDDSPYAHLFRVDPTGNLFTVTTLDADVGTTNLYELRVLAVDSEYEHLRSQALVIIEVQDVNDNAPIIQYPSPNNSTVYVTSDVALGHVLAAIRAVDGDRDQQTNARLAYSLQRSQYSEYFACDAYSGQIRTARSLAEFTSVVMTLEVAVVDAGPVPLSDNASLTVVVNASLPRSDNSKTQSLADNGNVVIVTSVAVVSGVLIVLLVIAIVALQRKDQLGLDSKRKRMAALFSWQKSEMSGVPQPSYSEQGHDDKALDTDHYQIERHSAHVSTSAFHIRDAVSYVGPHTSRKNIITGMINFASCSSDTHM